MFGSLSRYVLIENYGSFFIFVFSSYLLTRFLSVGFSTSPTSLVHRVLNLGLGSLNSIGFLLPKMTRFHIVGFFLKLARLKSVC